MRTFLRTVHFATGRPPTCIRLRMLDFAALCKERYNTPPLMLGVPVTYGRERIAHIVANAPHLDFHVLEF
ncbi:MAG: hypothetical protein HC841_00020 [Verrucomicrobiae bacterium]|nr:hypothetical protein [Verrucomicrobiae bacterium]